jgi:pyruvate kinase
MNLSHGTRDVHEEIFARLFVVLLKIGQPIAILVDLQGPKIRLEKFADGPHELAKRRYFHHHDPRR